MESHIKIQMLIALMQATRMNKQNPTKQKYNTDGKQGQCGVILGQLFDA